MAESQSKSQKQQQQQDATAADTTQTDPGASARASAESDRPQNVGDARVSAAATPTGADVHVTEATSAKYTSTVEGKVNPSTGQQFGEGRAAGLKGQYGFDLASAVGPVVAGVDPNAVPAEVSPGLSPHAAGDRLLAAAQAKAPSLTREFVQAMGLDDAYLAQIARGEVPPPPTPGPIHTADMYLTPGGFQQTPPGVAPQDVGGNQIHR